jgi:hypothetical protein
LMLTNVTKNMQSTDEWTIHPYLMYNSRLHM